MPPVMTVIYDFAVHRPFAVQGAKFFALHMWRQAGRPMEIMYVMLNMAPCSIAGGMEVLWAGRVLRRKTDRVSSCLGVAV